jgi:drug/metabolite transporter (DMT)-like permease
MALAAMGFFSAMLALIRVVGETIPVVEILTLRQLVMQALIQLVAGASFRALMRTGRPGLQALRGLFALGAMWGGFVAIVALPLAYATALSFTYALFATVGAALILREPTDRHRWTAVAVGFLGMLVMLRPEAGGSALHVAAALGSALSSAGMVLSLRVLSRGDSVATTLTWQTAVVLATTAPLTLAVWVTPDAREAALLLLIGLTGWAGHWLLTRAYTLGDTAAIAPLDFVRLVLMTAIGWAFFDERVDAAVLVGGALVVGATLHTLRRSARPGKEQP